MDTLGHLLSRVAFPSKPPRGWIPLYTMVTFCPDISYATAKKKAERQTQTLKTVGLYGTVVLGAATLGLTWMTLFHRTRSRV